MVSMIRWKGGVGGTNVYTGISFHISPSVPLSVALQCNCICIRFNFKSDTITSNSVSKFKPMNEATDLDHGQF